MSSALNQLEIKDGHLFLDGMMKRMRMQEVI